MIGQTLGHYRILEKIGAGGMGEVYLASDQVLGRRVAIKFLRAEILQDPAGKARFLREARAVAALSHPSIAVIHEIGEAEGCPYLVMEHIEGITLREELAAGPLPLPRLLELAAQIATALEHAHSRGIVHRDIKSSNIVLTKAGNVKLLDFGLAKPLAKADETQSQQTLTRPGAWVGTMHYVAPEVLSGQPADVRSDLYSFGMVLYEMACGQVSFAGLDGSALVAAILRGDVLPVRQRNPAVPPSLSRVIERALAANPDQRFARAAELVAALRELARGGEPEVPTEATSMAPLLALLEFQNISGDSAMDWLGRGIAETLAADLKKLKLIRVASREQVHDVVRRLGREAGLEEIGRQLRARWVVTGSYQRAGDRIRITPQLLEVATGEVLATGKVDGQWEDLFALQDRVVGGLLAALEVKADSSTMERIAPPETRQLEAYQHYAQGRQHFLQLGKNALEEARQHFERAVALDSRYALAYSGLGATHAMRFIHRTDPEDLARARAYLERAVELDPELGEPYPWLCYIYSRQGKIEEALSAGLKGVERQPDLVQAHYFCGVPYLIGVESNPDYYRRAVECLLKASEVDPRWEPTWLCLAAIALAVGNYDRAEQFLSRAGDLERTGTASSRFVGMETMLGSVWLRRGQWEKARQFYLQALESLATSDHMYRDAFVALSACGLGDTHLREGQVDSALADFRRAWRTAKEFPRMLGNERVLTRTLAGLACAYAAHGQRQRAQELAGEAAERLEEVTQQPQTWILEATTPQLYHALASARQRLGDAETALDLLEKAVDKGWRDPCWLETDPEMAPLRDQPRFRSLLESLHRLPPLEFELAKAAAVP